MLIDTRGQEGLYARSARLIEEMDRWALKVMGPVVQLLFASTRGFSSSEAAADLDTFVAGYEPDLARCL